MKTVIFCNFSNGRLLICLVFFIGDFVLGEVESENCDHKRPLQEAAATFHVVL